MPQKVYLINHWENKMIFINPNNPPDEDFIARCESDEETGEDTLEEGGYIQIDLVEYTPQD